jgi:hypothetical protein
MSILLTPSDRDKYCLNFIVTAVVRQSEFLTVSQQDVGQENCRGDHLLCEAESGSDASVT